MGNNDQHRTPSSLSRLMDAVDAMRHAQRDYFRTRSPAALERARKAERRVDALLRGLRKPTLFEE